MSTSSPSGYESESEDAAMASPKPHGGRGRRRRGDGAADGSPPPVSSSLGSKILRRRPPNWYQTYFIRMNRAGSFCMYPDLVDRSRASMKLKVDAHEFESLVKHEWIYEDNMWFYHLNFTTKTKEANNSMSSSNLFFAEVSHMQGEDAWKVDCCCIINPKDDGHCYGCRNNGSPDMQHPNDTNAYIGGHLDGYLPFGDDDLSGSDSEDEEAMESRLRRMYKGLDDPSFWEKFNSYFD
nr:unnamed protein product [Digitaria exilis]